MESGKAPVEPSASLVALVEDALGARATNWRKPHTGLSAAQRFVVTLANGSSCFVKAAVDAVTEAMLRTEHRVIMSVNSDFVPEVHAWVENGIESVLITEDLSDAYWPADHFRTDGRPVRFEVGQVETLLDTLQRVARTSTPDLPSLARHEPVWPAIAQAPEGFIGLGLCSAEWLERNVDALVAAEAALELNGDALVHNDVRSDNVCFHGERVILVDWSNARRGPDWFDRATLALTLPLETDHEAQEVAPDAGAYASWQAAALAQRALTQHEPAWLGRVLARMSGIALQWACASCDVEPPDGARWQDL